MTWFIYPRLTDDALIFAEGKHDALIGRLQKRRGKGQDEVCFGSLSIKKVIQQKSMLSHLSRPLICLIS